MVVRGSRFHRPDARRRRGGELELITAATTGHCCPQHSLCVDGGSTPPRFRLATHVPATHVPSLSLSFPRLYPVLSLSALAPCLRRVRLPPDPSPPNVPCWHTGTAAFLFCSACMSRAHSLRALTPSMAFTPRSLSSCNTNLRIGRCSSGWVGSGVKEQCQSKQCRRQCGVWCASAVTRRNQADKWRRKDSRMGGGEQAVVAVPARTRCCRCSKRLGAYQLGHLL